MSDPVSEVVDPELANPPVSFDGPLPEKAALLMTDEKNVARVVSRHIMKPRDPYVSEWNWASEAGDPCIRRLAYHRLYPERAVGSHEELAFIFRHGKFVEIEAMDELKEAGYEVVEQQRPYVDRRIKVKGKIDGKLVMHFGAKRHNVPFDIKGYSPWIWNSVNTAKDFLENDRPYLRKVIGQLTLYMLMDDAVTGGESVSLLYLKNKLTGMPKQIVIPLDRAYGMWIWKRLRVVNEHVRQKKLPPRIPYDENVCGRCPWRATCLSEMPAGASPLVLDPEKASELLDLLREREKLDPQRKAFKEVDDRVKEMVKGEAKIILAEFIISGKEIQKKAFSVKESSYWKTDIVNVKKPQESEG